MPSLLRDDRNETQQDSGNENVDEKFYEDLRSTGQMKYWLMMTKEERDRWRTESAQS
jgi:hypothetical protein